MGNSTIRRSSLLRVDNYYNTHATEFFNGTVNVDLSALYQQFLAYMPQQACILDAGCGSGRDTYYFLQQGYQVTAIDASAELCKLASRYTQHPIHCLAFHDITWCNQFAGIWACASLLHVPYQQLANVLDKLATALQAQGVLYASFKLGKGEWRDDKGRTFTNLDAESLQTLLHTQQITLTPIRMWTTQDARPDRASQAWFNVLLRKLSI